jgi:glycerol-3-phosphate dehydrogenase
VVPKFWDGPQAYLFQNDDKRVIFVNPYEGDLCLIGIPDNSAPHLQATRRPFSSPSMPMANSIRSQSSRTSS